MDTRRVTTAVLSSLLGPLFAFLNLTHSTKTTNTGATTLRLDARRRKGCRVRGLAEEEEKRDVGQDEEEEMMQEKEKE